MFSVENLYYILYCNLFKRINVDIEYFWKFGSIKMEDLRVNFHDQGKDRNLKYTCAFFYDQEPVQLSVLNERNSIKEKLVPSGPKWWTINHILITSEHSDLVNQYCNENSVYHLYYFFHGFACLHWFRDAVYFEKNIPEFDNKFLSFNRLCTSDRSYRLLFVSELIKRNMLDQGKISLQLIENNKNVVKEEIFSQNCRLSKTAKKQVFTVLGKHTDNFIIDKTDVLGSASAELGYLEYNTWQKSFLHIVSETVFFDQKLHLTEKIFKPIVSQRPFILLGAYKNLEYLKSYGFKTFDKWIDESYDNEPDNEKRLMMVCDEIEKIANLSEDKIKTMYLDMQQVLEHNYHHFYTDFKKIIINELVDNFQEYLNSYNVKQGQNVYDIESLNLLEIKRLLAQ